MKTVLIFLLSLLSVSARADILFIDFHHSANEVKAAREAATILGENLIVLAAEKVTTADVENFNRQKREYYAAQEKLNQLRLEINIGIRTFSGPDDAKNLLDETQAKVDAQLAALRAVVTKHNIDKNYLDRALSKLDSEHHTLTSLIVSGHSNGEELWGDEGGINRDEFLEVLNKHPKQKASLDSVLLWGCYAGKLENIDWWRKNFPRLGMIAGFAGAAPLAATAASPDLLKDVMLKQANIEKQVDVKSLERVFSGLQDANITNAALTTNGCYVANVEHVGRVTKDLKANEHAECARVEPGIIEGGKIFAKYYRAATLEFAVAPHDPHSSENPLRSFYNSIQTYDYCPGLMARVQRAIGVQFDISTVLGMIFFKNVLKNYEAFYGVKMGTNRMEVLKKISSPDFKQDKNFDAAIKLLGSLQCVPVSWITIEEPTNTPEAPSSDCLSRNGH